ncbi:importin-11 [Acrodontium crateriforme]|uniref:Importin-11 n=1 Tax=Acrodontium crateriforme TaxID=150365 RepID=A0AAQ3M7S3_9PEZI|nr:importin-11 [Acrodontium crateriforme]
MASSFAIEVPGEANPLTENLLIHTLRSASSSDSNQIQTGTKQLQQWEKSPGYYLHLQSAYIDRRLPVEVRYLAVIQLKNGIDKYWRKTANNAVSKEDKIVIRSRLLESGLNEPDDRLALQNALVTAKIARFEYPAEWPDAISQLVQTLRNASQLPPLQLARTLLTLLHVVKELSTGRLQRTRQNLQAATPEIVHVLGQLYADTVSFWQQRLNGTDDMETKKAMQLSLLVIKVLRRLLVFGYEHPNRDNDVTSFWSIAQQHLGHFIQLRKKPSVGSSIEPRTLLEKNMLQLAKLHHEMAKSHPAAFVLLPNSLDLVQAYWGLVKEFGETVGSKEVVTNAAALSNNGTDGDANDEKSAAEKMALRGLLILRACVKMVHSPAQTFKYRTTEDKEEKNRATENMKQQLLGQQFIQEIMEIIVTRFFVFRASDLKEWEEEPEEWEKREEGDGEDWEFSIRSCSEKLFLDLAINYKDMLVQPLLQVFYSIAKTNNEDVLFKDSVYTAIGLAAPVVFEALDFDAFIRDVLVTEVQKQKPGFGIIRRRAAILLGQWISIKTTERQLVYQIFQHLLDENDPLNDLVVRVTAGRQFSKIVDDWNFNPEQFQPYADVILTRLMHLIEKTELTETKMALLNTISIIVERMDFRISPFADRIVSLLPPLWEASEEEHLMKQAIITILARLVNAMKAESLPMHKMVVPIIQGAVEPGSESEVYLLDDAMELWGAILVQTPGPASQEVLQLVPHLFPIYELGSENLRKALEITESFVLLAPEFVLADETRTRLLTALSELLGTLRPDANGMVCNLVEVIIRSAHKLGGDAAVAQTAADLVQTGFLGKLLEGLRGSFIAHCTTGPNALDSPVDGIVETDYFAIIARLILGSLPGFCQACEAAAPSTDVSHTALDVTMKWLLEEWFSHFENIGDPSSRKLMALAMTKLLETNQPFILLRLQSLMTVWTDVITEMREDSADRNSDSLVYNQADSAAIEGPEAPEDERRREMTHTDVVHTVKLPDFVKQQLDAAGAACGGFERFQQEWLVNVDQDIVDAFLKLRVI